MEIRTIGIMPCFIAFVAFYIGQVEGTIVDFEKFVHIRNASISYGINESYNSTISSIDCARKCPDCQMISYDKATQECKVFQELNTTLTSDMSMSSVKIWIRQRTGVIIPVQKSGGTSITSGEATGFCKSFGAILAGPNIEFLQAFNEGLHLCECGFLHDGSLDSGNTVVKYSSQFEDTNCLLVSAAPMMDSCKTGGAYDTLAPVAYCTLA